MKLNIKIIFIIIINITCCNLNAENADQMFEKDYQKIISLIKVLSKNDFSQNRKKDREVRLHAWKRLTEMIDANWDKNELLFLKVSPPLSTNLPPGVEPAAIKDSVLRAEYEQAIKENNQKLKHYSEQNNYRKWLKRINRNIERYSIYLYSTPPINIEELQQLFKDYKLDKKMSENIISKIKK